MRFYLILFFLFISSFKELLWIDLVIIACVITIILLRVNGMIPLMKWWLWFMVSRLTVKLVIWLCYELLIITSYISFITLRGKYEFIIVSTLWRCQTCGTLSFNYKVKFWYTLWWFVIWILLISCIDNTGKLYVFKSSLL